MPKYEVTVTETHVVRVGVPARDEHAAKERAIECVKNPGSIDDVDVPEELKHEYTATVRRL